MFDIVGKLLLVFRVESQHLDKAIQMDTFQITICECLQITAKQKAFHWNGGGKYTNRKNCLCVCADRYQCGRTDKNYC